MNRANYEQAKAAYYAKKNEINAILQEIDKRRRYTIPQDAYTDVERVTIGYQMIVLHHMDGRFTPFVATIDQDGDPDFALSRTLDGETAVRHGLLDAKIWKELERHREVVDKKNGEIAEWLTFVELAKKFGVLVPENTVEV